MAFAIAALAAERPSTHRRRRRRRHLLPRFLRDAGPARGVKADKVYLVGFMAAGKTTVARALARRLDWQAVDIDELIEQRERLTVADIFAKHGEPYFRAAERAGADRAARPRGTSSWRPAAAPSSIRRTAPSSTSDGLSVWLDVPLDRADRAGAGRRPAAAGRRSRRVRTAVSSTARGVRTGARPARCRPRQRRRAGRTARRLAGALMRYLVLTDIHANLEALDTCLADARARGYDADARARRSRRLRRRSRTRSSSACRRSSRWRSCAATTTRSRAASSRPRVQRRRQERRAVDARHPDAGPSRLARARCPKGPTDVDDVDRDLPRLAVRRGRLHLRRARRRARAEGRDAAALPVRPHALPGHLRAVGRIVRQRRRRAVRPRCTCRCATAASTC